MSRHFCFRIVHQQSADQYAERVALPFRACVFGIPIVVQSTFVGDSDRVGIVAAGVGAGPLDRTCGQDLSVTVDVEMIARAIKSTSAVRGFQSLPGKGTVLARGAAMYHNQVDFSHFFLQFAFGGCALGLPLFMACALNAPKSAEATAMITFRILSQADDFVLMMFDV